MLPARLRVLYLHGFASGAKSRKASFFVDKLSSFNIPIQVPDLSQGDFEHLTITSQLEVIHRVIGSEPVVLIGSSLGGYLAALCAARYRQVTKLVLLAPAFGLYHLWVKQLGPERIKRWQEEGSLSVFHYAEGKERAIRYQLLEDSRQYSPFPDFGQPALIFHGNQDDTVPVDTSIEFAGAHPNVELVRINSGHELTDALDAIWQKTQPFLFGNILENRC
ncbi:MAG: alpha/beta fold hydrolase [Acidobacteriaceae bacterium]|nr:alpha/beta fold hydrolase [Acidobacteriaceae bacterium]MBV9938803.1 alpha/beta fold hydrolase [Acidobacteriaceae bacterium]